MAFRTPVIDSTLKSLRTDPARRKNIGDEIKQLLTRVRSAVEAKGGLSEKPMFGGVGFLRHGNLVAAASKRGLLLRVGKERYAEALLRPGIRPMEMRGREMPGYVYLDPATADDAALKDWLNLAVRFVETLPSKPSPREKRQRKSRP